MSSCENHCDDDEEDIPLQHQRPFGSGIRRQKVTFVRASSPELNTTTEPPTPAGSSVADLYLSLVLPDDHKPTASVSAITQTEGPKEQLLCPVCKLPVSEELASVSHGETSNITGSGSGSGSSQAAAPRPESARKHEASIAHQVCVAHSHPPSAVDRTRKGLAVLAAYGWDPDARRGLGASEQGMAHPLKVRRKDDTLGLGLRVPKEFLKDRVAKRSQLEKQKQKLTAKQCRTLAEEDRKKGERLRSEFYGREDVEKYLRG